MTPYYEEKGITIYHGDCLELLPLISVGSIASTVTDPPYLMGSASTRSPSGRPRSRIGDWTNAACWYQTWMAMCWNLMRDSGSLWMCCNWRSVPTLMIATDQIGAQVASMVIWDKGWIGVGPLNGLRQRYELVMHVAKSEHAIVNRSEPDIWAIPWASQRPTGHESEKPVGLPQKAIELSAGGTILDPFMGSGTTLRAAKDLGRNAIGIEIEERYCEIAANRLRQEVLSFEEVA